MNEEQLLQEARKEAEKVIPNGTYNIDCFDECVSEIAREGFVDGYIANANKQMSEALTFAKYVRDRSWIKIMDCDLEDYYVKFKQQKQ